MADFLLELLCEEIPARMQAKAAADLAHLFGEQLGEAGLASESIETHVTPRRLILIARGLPPETEASSEEYKGPRTSAPDVALEGFLRKTGVARESLVDREGIWFATVERPGRSASELLAGIVPQIIHDFPWPKSMRWGAASVSTESLRWVRPLQGIVALLGHDGDVQTVDLEVEGTRSGTATLGHRFHHPGTITIGGVADYAEKMRACRVMIDAAERRDTISKGAQAAAEGAGLRLVEDVGLVAENAGLTEWPVALIGRFDPGFLEVPREIIQLTMRTNQKYFALTDAEGALAPFFVSIANIEAADGGESIREGNRKVLAARLADAKFFWEQDLKVPLAAQAARLSEIVFHEKLGTLADKVERVARLAAWLVQERLIKGADAQLVDRAARLAKADLVTQSVGEFPELQGTLGAYLARAQGEPGPVANAIGDHYRPGGQGDRVPTDPVTLAVNVADRIDTLTAFFSIGERPTGSRDPYALRRAALGLIQMTVRAGLRIPLADLVLQSAVVQIVSRLGALSSIAFPDLLDEEEGDHEITAEVGTFTYRYGRRVVVRWKASLTPNVERGKVIEEATELQESILEFIADRLKVQQREAGVRHDLIGAVFALGSEDDLVRLLARVKALQSFVERPEGADLLAGYKRAANILKKEGWKGAEGRRSSLNYAPMIEESELDDALDAAEPRVAAAIEEEDFERAMNALASLRRPIDAFFDKVTVNDPDPVKRAARLDLLARMRNAVHRVADFSRIEG